MRVGLKRKKGVIRIDYVIFLDEDGGAVSLGSMRWKTIPADIAVSARLKI